MSENKGEEKVDFIKLLNHRDSLAMAKSRSDSIDLVLLREIRNINRRILDDALKYGDRAR